MSKLLDKNERKDSLTLEQYCEIVKFVQKYHHFALYNKEIEAEIKEKFPKLIEKGFSHGLNIKYIDNIYDSRDARVWSVTFRGGSGEINFQHCANMYERIMKYLTTGESKK